MPNTSMTFTIDPQALDVAKRYLTANLLRSALDAADPSRAIPRTLPPSEPCQCLLCRRRRGELVTNHFVSDEIISDAAAAASARAVLADCTPGEIAHVRAALRAGEIEGRSPFRCFLARILECRGLGYMLMPVEWRATAIEDWVIAFIHAGDTPENSEHAALLDRWLTIALEERQRPPSIEYSIDGTNWIDLTPVLHSE